MIWLSISYTEVSNSSGWQWPSAAVWPKCNPGKKQQDKCHKTKTAPAPRIVDICYHPIMIAN